jgi:hypothetical protein
VILISATKRWGLARLLERISQLIIPKAHPV